MTLPEGAHGPDLRPAPREAPQELRLDLPAAHSAARMARHLVRQFARAGGVTGNDLDSLVLVADELLSNAVDHGGGNGSLHEHELPTTSRMGLLLDVRADGWQMCVSDQGGGDPALVESLIHPEGLPDLESERGRGFFLLAQMVDTLEVRRSDDGRGLLLVASRHLPRHG